jgi:hypothetical protein
MHLTAHDDKDKAWYAVSDINEKKNVVTRVPYMLDKGMFSHDYFKQYFDRERGKANNFWTVYLVRDSVTDCTTDENLSKPFLIRKNPFFKLVKKFESAAKPQASKSKVIKNKRSVDDLFIKLEKGMKDSVLYYYWELH